MKEYIFELEISENSLDYIWTTRYETMTTLAKTYHEAERKIKLEYENKQKYNFFLNYISRVRLMGIDK